MPTNEQLQALLDDYVTGAINEPDKQLLLIWLGDPAIALQAERLLQQELESGRYESDPLPGIQARLHARLREVMDATSQPVAHKPSLLRRLAADKRWWAAAAIIILAGAGMYQYFMRSSQLVIAAVPEKDVPPGSNRAILTLADGATIILDSAVIGKLAQQGSSTVSKTQNGQLIYDAAVSGGDQPVIYNTLTTPRGGQFQVTLPDGTKVWLNAASSVKYPTSFTGKERKVTITGEVYFEIAQMASMPFKVQKGNLEVQVLGTHFNANAYDEEPDIKITLLQGSVKVIQNEENKILRPGEQVTASAKTGLTINHSPDIDEVMAWKNGAFNFNNKSLEEVMRQLARWYDIEVVYKGKAPAITFEGEMGRDVHLSKVLAFLRESRVRCQMENGRKLVVTN